MSDEELIENDLRTRIGEVVFNASNYPRRAQARILGENVAPFRELIVGAALAVFREHGAEHDRQVAERAWGEGAQIGYVYGREDEKFSLANAVPTANPYRKEQ